MRLLPTILLAFVSLATSAGSSAHEDNLPLLGDTSSSMISPAQERLLGQEWLRLYRSQVPTSSDPVLVDYLERLVGQLAQYSQLQDKRLDVIVAENPTLNAFAVPGGVMGIHTGLLQYAKTEGQLAAVIGHELAHLSQRHYARRLEQEKRMTVPFYAAMLASLVLLASSSDSDAGLAALSATQAVALDAQLRFSRQNEQEADRLGLQTIVAAGYDPMAPAEMFEEMLRGMRYSRRPPEFLLTHPVTESRISDARNRVHNLARTGKTDSLEYQLVRARVRVTYAESPQLAVKRFHSELEGDTENAVASRYGLAMAYTLASQFNEARKTLAPLLAQSPDNLFYQLMATDIEVAAGNYPAALAALENLLKANPNNHPVIIRYAEALMKAGSYERSAEVLERYSRRRNTDDYVWYLLAEVNGLAGNILGVHEARAEYFILNGVYDKAQIQLRNALKLADGNFHRTALLEERMKTVQRLQQNRPF